MKNLPGVSARADFSREVISMILSVYEFNSGRFETQAPRASERPGARRNLSIGGDWPVGYFRKTPRSDRSALRTLICAMKIFESVHLSRSSASRDIIKPFLSNALIR